MPEGEEPGEAVVEDQLRQARQALADAEGAQDAQLSDVVIINRLYYACFHAAQAVLYHRGHDPTSHRGVLTLFGSEVVVAGDASRQDGRFLNDLSELRNRADYGYGELDENIDALLTRSQQFVSQMEALCSASNYSSVCKSSLTRPHDIVRSDEQLVADATIAVPHHIQSPFLTSSPP